MQTRREVLGGLEGTEGIIVVDWGTRKVASQELEAARKRYEEARITYLRNDLSLFYRLAIFGSARLDSESTEFQFVTSLTEALVEARDMDIVTGGGPGIMEAANLGTRLAIGKAQTNGKKLKAKNLGETISLPFEQDTNKHLDRVRGHSEFSTRLQAFLDSTQAAYNAPGGVGTLFEMTLLLQTQQVGHLERDYPIVAHPFWRPIVDSWHNNMYRRRREEGSNTLISEGDLERIQFSDHVPTIVDIFSRDYDRWMRNIRSKVRIIND